MNTFTRTVRTFTLLLIVGALPLAAVGQSVEYTDDMLRYKRPVGQDGVTTFEPSMEDDTPYDGFAVKLGGAFAQQLQGITQSNDAGDLPDIGRGFNLATANLDLDAQMAEGIRLHVRTYLSSRHHPEAWVKGGYLQVNELPFDGLEGVMRNVSVRAGHFMPNYGDTHFRRTDNADAIQNPFVGNTIVDAFTTEVGAEATVQSNGFLAVGGFGGQLNPTVENPDDRAPSFYGKLGYDDEVTDGVRVRLTGSVYHTSESNSGQLHSGDRAGSRYYNVVSGGDWSGRLRVNYGDQVTAFMLNPFVKVGGLELFGTIETITGEGSGLSDGSTNQYAAEAVYRFLDDDLYVGARYNTVSGDLNLAGRGESPNWNDVGVDRWQLGAGWFMTKNILVKTEYVTQSYNDYPTGAAEAGAEFDGIMVEGVVSF
ncbi:MAG: hypothetical protein ACLFTE_09725 [Salinivenus sp.]